MSLSEEMKCAWSDVIDTHVPTSQPYFCEREGLQHVYALSANADSRRVTQGRPDAPLA